MHLDRPIDHVVEHAGDVELDQGGLDACLAALVHDPSGVERHQAGGLDLGSGFGDVAVDLTFVAEQRAVGVTDVGPAAHQFEGAFGLTEPLHAVEHPDGL